MGCVRSVMCCERDGDMCLNGGIGTWKRYLKGLSDNPLASSTKESALCKRYACHEIKDILDRI